MTEKSFIMQINKDLIIEGTGKSLYDLTTVTKQGTTVSKNNTSDIAISGNKVIHSTTLTINSGKALMIGSLYLKHDGGTPQVQFLVDGSNYGGFFASQQNEVYSFSLVVSVSKGKHTFSLNVNQGNASNVKVGAYTASELTVVEV